MTSLLQNENENETEKGTIEELQERVRLAETTLQDARACVVELCKAERGVQTDSDAIRQAKKRARSAKKNLKSSLHALKECKRITEKEGMIRQEAELRGDDMLATVIDEESDPRLDSYRNLKDSSDRRRQGKFIAEGPETISLLLKSDVRIESLLLKPTVFEKLRPAINTFLVYLAGFLKASYSTYGAHLVTVGGDAMRRYIPDAAATSVDVGLR